MGLLHDTGTGNSGLGLHLVDLPTDKLTKGAVLCFTFCWAHDDRWEGEDYYVQVV
jgi:glucoamylase